MATYSAFLNTQIACYPTSTADPFFASWLDQYNHGFRYDLNYKFNYVFNIDSGVTKTVKVPSSLGGPLLVVMRVIGEAYMTILTGAMSDTAKLPAYGTAEMPGYVIVSADFGGTPDPTVTSTSDDTEVELLFAVIV